MTQKTLDFGKLKREKEVMATNSASVLRYLHVTKGFCKASTSHKLTRRP